MALGIGIDTGGTYTDAVIYDFDSKTILSFAKALTTHEKLEIGIMNCLSKLDNTYFPSVELVALSTTLATNACVENKGGRAKLLFFGVDARVFDKAGARYGLKSKDEVYLCRNSSDFNGSKPQEPDWDELLSDLEDFLEDAQGLGIVEVFAMNSGASLEKTAKEKVLEKYDMPVVCGHELFYELNSLQRGSSTLLNAKLVPIIQDFIESIKQSLSTYGIQAPLAIIRSDSTKMSEEYSRMRPVETILSGPASSVTGGLSTTLESDCLVVDIGGTTTDISIVKDGQAISAEGGIKIGDWRTFVNGVYIDTFGLGGDSTIRVEHTSIIQLPKRMMPFCIAAARWPQITEKLEALLRSERYHSHPIYEFLYLVKKPDSKLYSKDELALCEALKHEPLMYEEAAKAAGKDLYTLDISRLETEGVVMRIGMTPTDIMHIKGDYNLYDNRPSLLAAQYITSCILDETGEDISVEQFCDLVYDAIKLKLYENIVRILLKDKYPLIYKEDLDERMQNLIKHSYWDKEDVDLPLQFKTAYSLVGIGAPTHIFLPDVAKALGTKCIIPKHAEVANAIGAIVSNVRSVYKIEVRTELDGSFTVFAPEGKVVMEDFEEAVEYAKKAASDTALSDAYAKGMTGKYNIETKVNTNIAKASKGQKIDLGTTVFAEVTGLL